MKAGTVHDFYVKQTLYKSIKETFQIFDCDSCYCLSEVGDRWSENT